MTQQLSLYFPQSGLTYEVPHKSQIVAGMSETCDLCLQSYMDGRLKIISRQHFKLVVDNQDGYAIVDLKSLNGTVLNDEPLEPYRPRFLRHGDLIMLAGYPEFLIEVISEDEAQTEAATQFRQYFSRRMIEPGISIDRITKQFIVDGMPVPYGHFTPLEYNLLRHLQSKPEKLITYDELAEALWEGVVQNNTIAKTISNVRYKLDNFSPDAGNYIKTVHGRGFLLRSSISNEQ